MQTPPVAIAEPPPALLVDLNHALAAENLSFSTFVLMLACYREREPVSVARLSVITGMGYYAVRNQVKRTPWFLTHFPGTAGANQASGPLASVTLTTAAQEKVLRVGKRIRPV